MNWSSLPSNNHTLPNPAKCARTSTRKLFDYQISLVQGRVAEPQFHHSKPCKECRPHLHLHTSSYPPVALHCHNVSDPVVNHRLNLHSQLNIMSQAGVKAIKKSAVKEQRFNEETHKRGRIVDCFDFNDHHYGRVQIFHHSH